MNVKMNRKKMELRRGYWRESLKGIKNESGRKSKSKSRTERNRRSKSVVKAMTKTESKGQKKKNYKENKW